jgi:hypothetical protein
MLKKLTKRKDEGIEDRKATIIIPPPILDCYIGCTITCDPDIPPKIMAEPTGQVCFLIS